MAPDTFHLFPNFPKEIQDLIWDAAVRPVPGTRHVHRFMVSDHQALNYPVSGHLLDFTSFGIVYSEDEEWNEEEEEEDGSVEQDAQNTPEGAPSSMTRMAGCYNLAIPCDDVDGSPNDSVYALYSGLWMACKASRAAMERHFSRNEWWSEPECEDAPARLATSGDYYRQDGATHTASYENDDGEHTYITIGYDRDLFCLDPRNLGCMDWYMPDSPDFPA